MATLHDAFQDILAEPELRQRLEDMGYAVDSQGPDQARERIADESARYQEVIDRAGIRVE